MKKQATPWIKTQCGGEPKFVDLELEKFNSTDREKTKVTPKYMEYVDYVKKFFKSDNPRELVHKAWKSKVLPVWCENTQSILLVDADSGEPIKKVAASIKKSNTIKMAMDLIYVARLINSDDEVGMDYEKGEWYRDEWQEYKKKHPNTKIKNPKIKLRDEKWRDKEWSEEEWDEYRQNHPDTEIRPKFKKD